MLVTSQKNDFYEKGGIEKGWRVAGVESSSKVQGANPAAAQAPVEAREVVEEVRKAAVEAADAAAEDIFGEDKVLIFNYEEPASCILIYDKNITTSFRQSFEQLWKQAKF